MQLLPLMNEHQLVIPQKRTKRDRDDSKEGYQGAWVIPPKKGFFLKEYVACLDYTSLYPSIMMQWNMCWTTIILKDDIPYCSFKPDDYEVAPDTGHAFLKSSIKPGILPRLLKKLFDQRKQKKGLLKNYEPGSMEHSVLDRLQLALKVTANSFYGFCGAPDCMIPRLEISSSVTAFGRSLLNQSKSLVETEGYEVYYGDTDSIMVGIPKATDITSALSIGRELESFLNVRMPSGVQFKVEEIMYNPLFIQKKHYTCIMYVDTGVAINREMLFKGIDCIRRDRLPYVVKTMKQYLHILIEQEDINKAYKLVLWALAKLKRGQVAINDLVIIKGLSKPLEGYDINKAPPLHVATAIRAKQRDENYECAPGTRIAYVYTVPTQKNEKVCNTVDDPEYVLENFVALDFQKYSEIFCSAVEKIITVVHGENAYHNLLKQTSTMFQAPTQRLWHKFQKLQKPITLMCARCNGPIPKPGYCVECQSSSDYPGFKQKKKEEWQGAKEKKDQVWKTCYDCQNGDIETAKLCVARECNNFYPRMLVDREEKCARIEYEII